MSSKFSQDIKALLIELAAKPMTLREMMKITGDRGVNLIIALLILPFLLPMPPGLSWILGGGCFCLATQIALGKKSLWLPKAIARFKFSRNLSRQLLKNIGLIASWLEKIARPRWQSIVTNRYTYRINGLCIAWLSILLVLPVPFTNPFPTIAILVLAVATLETDGLVLLIGYFLTLANTILFVFIGYALWQAPQLLPKFFRNGF